MHNESEFKHDLEHLINKYSIESSSNTPDFILAEYLVACLKVFNATTKARSKWYGHVDTPGEVTVDAETLPTSQVT